MPEPAPSLKRVLTSCAWMVPLWVLVSVAYTWPLAQNISNTVPGDQRDPLLNAALLDHVMRSLATGAWAGLWETPFFFPNPHRLAFSESLLGTAWYGIPLWWLAPSPVALHNLFHMAGLVFSAVSASVLCAVVTRNAGAALLGGVVFGFSPFHLMHSMHVQMHQAWGVPLIILGLWWVAFGSAARAWGWTLAATALALQVLSCSYLGLYSAAVALPFVVGLLVARRRLLWSQDRWPLVVGVAMCTVLLLPPLRHYAFVNDALGLERAIGEVRSFSLNPAALFAVPAGLRFPTSGARVAPNAEATLWPGRVAPILLLTGLLSVWRLRKDNPVLVRTLLACACAGGLCVWMAAGPGPQDGPSAGYAYSWFYHLVPGFNGLRVPPRFLGVLMAWLALAAACAVPLLAHRHTALKTPMSVLMAFLAAADVWPNRLPVFPLPDGGNMGPVLQDVVNQQQPGPMVEVPYRLYWRSAQHDLNTTRHHLQTANGYSGVEPPLSLALRYVLPSFPLSGTDAWVQQLGVRTLVLHRGEPRADPGERAPFLEEALAAHTLPAGFDVRMNQPAGAWLNVTPQQPGPLSSLKPAWSSRVTGCGVPGPQATARILMPVEHAVVSPTIRYPVEVQGARGKRLHVTALSLPGIWWGALPVQDWAGGTLRVNPPGSEPLLVQPVEAQGITQQVTVRTNVQPTYRRGQGFWFRAEVEPDQGVLRATTPNGAGHRVLLRWNGPPAEIRPTSFALRTDAASGCSGVAEGPLEFLRGTGQGTLVMTVVNATGQPVGAAQEVPVFLQ